MHLNNPPAQGIHDQAADHGMITVAGVAAAGKIQVGPGPWIKQIIDGVVNAPEGRGGPVPAAFSRVIINNVQDDLDTGLMQTFYHVPELVQGMTTVTCIGGFGCKKGQGAVTPVIFELLPGFRVLKSTVVFVKFSYRHELNSRYSQLF